MPAGEEINDRQQMRKRKGVDDDEKQQVASGSSSPSKPVKTKQKGSDDESAPDQVCQLTNAATITSNTTSSTSSQVQQPVTQQQQNEQPPPRGMFGHLRSMLMNMLIFWLVTKFLLGGRQTPTQTPSSNLDSDSQPKTLASNLYHTNFPLDMYAYVSEDSYEPDFFSTTELKWTLKNIPYGEWYHGANKDSTFSAEFDVTLSPKVQNNGTLWLHVYFVKAGDVPYEQSRDALNYSPIYTLHRKKQITKYKKRKLKDTHNLITGKTDKSIEDQEKIKNKIKEEIMSHWHPNMTINMVYDQTNWPPGNIPSPLNEHIDFEPSGRGYYPIVYLNDYWNLMRDFQPINNSVKSITLHMTYQPLSMFKWQLYAAQAMKNKWSNMLGTETMESEDEQDTIKETLLETSPILLALTVIVSIAHSVFEFLAFKNDIQFWNERKSLEGLSVRSVFFNVFQSVVILLYVLDNDTNTIIRISIGIGLLIELWKIPKVVDIKVDRANKILGVIPRIRFDDKGSYVESSTRQYDLLAYKYLSWVIFPLFVSYGVYSLLYNEHKGWYSFVLNMTYGFLLAFGFIMMTPQLFINYKLKSVAHLPWRMLSYKFLNTFIDDIFAFVIKMPLMYRLGCFRDDIIFIIYLYQRWIYRVDPKRVNEFGISGEQIESSTNKAISQSATQNQTPTQATTINNDNDQTTSATITANTTNG